MLGNKCTGQHNLKTVHFRETLASDNFLVCSSAIRVFFSALYLPQDSWGKLLYNDGGGDPLKALLEGALGQQAACQLWFHFQEKIKSRWCEICEKWSWENIFTPFSTASCWKKRQQWLFGHWPGKKQVLYRHARSKPKNHYKSLLGSYEGKLQ